MPFLASGLMCALLIAAGLRLGRLLPLNILADTPGARSLHSTPKPRTGGIAIIVSFLLVGVTEQFFQHAPALLFKWPSPAAAILLLLVVSLFDDFRGLSPFFRFAVQLTAAVVATFPTIEHPVFTDSHFYGILFLVFLAISLTWSANLFNFMDGADGLAGGMALIGFGALSFGAQLDANAGAEMQRECLWISGAAAGFLLFNFSPARLFMGDTGSVTLGFVAAYFSLLGSLAGHWPWWFGPAIFSCFIVDATVTLAKRAAARKVIWHAHREHYYQHLILSGWSHRKTCFAYYILMLTSAICALSAKNSPRPWTWLLPLVITYASLIAVLEWRFHQEKEDGKKSGTG